MSDNDLLNVVNSSLILYDTEPVTSEVIDLMNDIRQLNKTEEVKDLIRLPEAEGQVTEKVFEDCIYAYETNQEYYINKLEMLNRLREKADSSLEMEIINRKLNQIRKNVSLMEYWLLFIIEPKPKDKREHENWKEGELSKITNGRTKYCNNKLFDMIEPLPSKIKVILEESVNSNLEDMTKRKKKKKV